MPAEGFFAIARAEPDRPALVDPAEATSTFGELLDDADRVVAAFRSLGLAAGDTIAVALPNSRQFVVAYAAAIRAGLVFVPVNWHLTGPEIAYIVENSEAKLLVSHERFAPALAVAGAALDPSRRFAVGAVEGYRPFEELLAGDTSEQQETVPGGLVMFYTSGTTGRPKGVRKRITLPPDAPIGLATGIGVPVPAADDGTALVGGPLYHGNPLAAMAMALDAGQRLVLMERWTPEGFLRLVERYRVTNAVMVPTMFHRLLALPDEVRLAADVSSLRRVMHGGAPCPIDTKRRMIEWLGPILVEGYSSTEGAGTLVTSEEWLARPGTVGRPSPGVTLKILDDDGHECPTGTPGRVFVSQALWQFEYLGDEEKTRANRVGDLFTVGDIGYVDDEGYLFLCDRVADVIVSGGVNIYPAEVEGVLLEHPAVGDAAVVGAPNDEWGEEVRAVVEPRAGVAADDALAADIIRFCRDRLAHYKCPVAVDFVDSLGRDPNGKLRKQVLRDRYWAGRTRRI